MSKKKFSPFITRSPERYKRGEAAFLSSPIMMLPFFSRERASYEFAHLKKGNFLWKERDRETED